MFDKRKAKKIKRDLETRFPNSKFKVEVRKGDEVFVWLVGGQKDYDDLPTYEQAVSEMTKVIRQTIPNFEWSDYDTSEGIRYLYDLGLANPRNPTPHAPASGGVQIDAQSKDENDRPKAVCTCNIRHILAEVSANQCFKCGKPLSS